MTRLAKLFGFIAPMLVVAVACDSPAEDPGPGRDRETTAACAGKVRDKSGRGVGLNELNDPFAQLVLKSQGSCPTTYAAVMDRLRETDTDDNRCKGEANGGARTDGFFTRVISETAAPLDQPTSYRTVTTRECNDRERFSLIISSAASQDRAPSRIEVMSFDENTGVFNYYDVSGGRYNFNGNSIDYVELEDPEAVQPFGNFRGCAPCHSGGGMVMKELDTPWLHWDSSHMRLPGAQEMLDAHDDLGGSGNMKSGAEMEGLTNEANRTWNQTRVKHFRDKGDAVGLLKPLFCGSEVNLDNAVGFPGNQVTSIPVKALQGVKTFGSGLPSFSNDDYLAQLEANGQRVPGIGQVDTHIPFTFIERSESDIDYIGKLTRGFRIGNGDDAEEIPATIDQEFVEDVMAVDLTRPVFSSDRCGLLEHAENIVDLTPEGIVAGFKKSLEDDDSPAAVELLRNLNSDVDDANQAVNTFFANCSEKRDPKEFLADALAYISLNRNLARDTLHVFEFPATMPVDNLRVPEGTRFDPNSCELVTEFVSAPTGEPEPEPEPEEEDDSDDDSSDDAE